MKSARRFKGLKLSASDLRELRRRCGAGQQWTARIWRRMQTLLMLHRGMTLDATAAALGTYGREVSRVARRYLDKGLEHALGEEPRLSIRNMPKLDSTQEAHWLLLYAGRRLKGVHGGRSACWKSKPCGAEWSIESAEKRSEWCA